MTRLFVLLVALFATSANAGNIVVTAQIGAMAPVDLATFGGVGSSNGYSMSDSAIAAFNTYLTSNGSQYQFAPSSIGATTLGGVSNFPGDGTAFLTLSGTALSVTSGQSLLTLVETQTNYATPTGPSGTLFSSSTGNFINETNGIGHIAQSSYNGTSTPLYSVLAPGGVRGGDNGVNVPISPVLTDFTLSNTIILDLSAGAPGKIVVDSFTVIGAVSAVPEPNSIVLLGIGFIALWRMIKLVA
jgi:hypothetical protein